VNADNQTTAAATTYMAVVHTAYLITAVPTARLTLDAGLSYTG
jgi:hypothetical protein